MLNEIREGVQVQVPCSISRGAFLNEYLITIDTSDGPISGFIDADFVNKSGDDSAYICGVVHEIRGDTVIISLPGSFFTTTGIAHFSRKVLESAL